MLCGFISHFALARIPLLTHFRSTITVYGVRSHKNRKTHAHTHIFMDHFLRVFVILLLLQILMDAKISRRINANRKSQNESSRECKLQSRELCPGFFIHFKQLCVCACVAKHNNHRRQRHQTKVSAKNGSSQIIITIPIPQKQQ